MGYLWPVLPTPSKLHHIFPKESHYLLKVGQWRKAGEVTVRPRNPLSNLISPKPGNAYHYQSHLLLELAHDISHGPAAVIHPLLLSENEVRVEIGTAGFLQGFLLSAQHNGPLRRETRRVTMGLRWKNTRKERRKRRYLIRRGIYKAKIDRWQEGTDQSTNGSF